jgi:uncharacterized iron-regulated membrane protein
VLYQVLTAAITRTIATEVAGQDLDLEHSYRFGFARLGPVLVVSILVGLATLLGLIVFIIPGIYIWWHAAFTLLVAALITGVVNAVITAPFSAGAWFVQGVTAALATTVTLPSGALVGVLLYLDLRAGKERLASTPSRPTWRPRRPDRPPRSRRHPADQSADREGATTCG